jgi:hypothetical protein
VTPGPSGGVVRIANCSAFYGDRFSAAREMVEDGPIDVLTGDWLAELTMLILAKDRARDAAAGYARTFPAQMEQVMGTCLERGIKVVANAGGLNPAGCARAVEKVAADLGLDPGIAWVGGDDLLPRLDELRAQGHDLAHFDTGEPFGARSAVTANAYLGCWGIVRALTEGADIVITGRMTDAAVVMGPAAWYHQWERTDWDRLAGACVAGHVIECGPQATGGNYSFFTEIPTDRPMGYPLAEIAADGSSVITKHPGTGGAVTVGTVTAQLLYEIGGPRYGNPDVVARFDTIRLGRDGPDRVSVSGVRGESAPPTLKVCVNYLGGWRNTATFCLTGLDIEEKAALVDRLLWAGAGGRDRFASVHTELVRSDHADPGRNEQAVACYTLTVKDPDRMKVGLAFKRLPIEMALASYPGFFSPDLTRDPDEFGVYWPALVPSDVCASEVHVGDAIHAVANTAAGLPGEVVPAPDGPMPAAPTDETVRVPLGRVVGARSGDKGGDANVGLWAASREAYAWLRDFLTAERMASLFPEAREHPVERYEFPNLLALNFVVRGLLDEGVAATPRQDAQAKGLAEYVRARIVDVPRSLVVPRPS